MNLEPSPRDDRPAGNPAPARRSRALVLSGGGALGALQAGFLHALFRTSYRPSMIIGTSAGALNGAFLSFFPDADGTEKLAEIWKSLRNKRLFLFNPARVAYQVVSRQLCLANSRLLQELVERHAPEDDFAATKVPLYITTTNLTQGCKSVFHDGPVSRAVLASTALPGIFCPVEIGGDLYVDGGVLANLDLDTAVELGASEILAVDLSRCIEGTRPSDIPSLWSQTLDIVQRERVERDVERLASRARITVVQPGVESPVSLGNLAAVDRLLEEGERLGEDVLSSYVDDNGAFRAGTIHAPLHIHPFAESVTREPEPLSR
ncbi:MAG: patatin-like phospholipase family protein [Dehalococcoidia bacterium]